MKISIRIDQTKIDQSAIYAGRKGEYLDALLIENRDGPGKYGDDGYIVQGLPKDRRLAGEKGPIIGNFTYLADTTRAPQRQPSPQTQPQPQQQPTQQHDDDIPF